MTVRPDDERETATDKDPGDRTEAPTDPPEPVSGAASVHLAQTPGIGLAGFAKPDRGGVPDDEDVALERDLADAQTDSSDGGARR